MSVPSYYEPPMVGCDPNIFERLYDRRLRMENTDDYHELRKCEEHLVFVYGTLKKGHPNHELLAKAKPLGVAQTCVGTFCMKNNGGMFPVVTKKSHSMFGNTPVGDSGRINGELYAVDTLTMIDLDRLEANGRMYNRVKTWFWMRDQQAPVQGSMGVQAWMYLGDEDFWKGTHRLETIPATKEFGKNHSEVSWHQYHYKRMTSVAHPEDLYTQDFRDLDVWDGEPW